MGGHNDDLHGNTAATYGLAPGGSREEGETLSLPRPWFKIGDLRVDEPNDLKIPEPPETYACFMLQTFRGYLAGDASAVNERQVAVVGGLSLAMDRSDKAEEVDPVNKAGLAGGARYVALRRSRTARECVETLGALLSQYGAVFPSCVGIADPREAWYFEIGGGSTWLAVRVPDDHYMAQSNGYRIQEVDLDDADNVISSKDLGALVREKGLWKPEDGLFNWARAFGGKMSADPEKGYYNARRVWSVMNRFSPSLKLDPAKKEFPLFVRADGRISVAAVMEGLRDTFEGTPFEAFPKSGGRGEERPACAPSCIHSAVVDPGATKSVLWGCVGSPLTSPYVPHYMGHESLLPPYEKGGLEFDRDSAFWRFRALTNLVMNDYQTHAPMVREVWSAFEENIHASMAAMEAEASRQSAAAAKALLTAFSNALDALAYQEAANLEAKLHTKIAERQYLNFAKPGLEW
jgi:dipeptidase